MKRYFTLSITLFFAIIFFASCNKNKHIDYQGITFDYPENWTVITEFEDSIISIESSRNGDSLGIFYITAFEGNLSNSNANLEDYLRSNMNVLDEAIPVKIRKHPIKDKTCCGCSGKGCYFDYKISETSKVFTHLFAFKNEDKTYMMYYSYDNPNSIKEILTILSSFKVK